MIPFPDGSYEKHGMDVLKVYRPDETSVIKLRRLNADTRWYNYWLHVQVAMCDVK